MSDRAPADRPLVAILAGGLGTRLAEHTETRPKPMVEIGGRPLLWHIMKHYHRYSFTEFVIALGYRAELVKRWFRDYHELAGDLTVRLPQGRTEVSGRPCERWTVHLVDTGQRTETGGRLHRLRPWLGGRTFMATYGDGVSDVDLDRLLGFHRAHGRLATVTAVRPPARFGGLVFDRRHPDLVAEFGGRRQVGEGWINGGFMVLEPAVLDLLDGDDRSLEADGLQRLAECGQLAAYRHGEFWQCMDTLRDVRLLQDLWQRGAPWRTWS